MDLETCRRSALSSLQSARRGYRQRAYLYQVGGDMDKAILWTMEYWLAKQGHQPDRRKPWGLIENDFRALVQPGDAAYALLVLRAPATRHSIDAPEDIPPASLPSYESLGELLASAGAAIEAVLAEQPRRLG